ncbi:type II secretion system F family protein [Paenibacillus sedimenti]|uniref:Type II secretion system F family protein n=1 Tax=Paenibacillus sedimenti TaxID=2770274 RepID=A0A926KLU0_9BACL|nr:type II secretion system F family protein [Paenibacillus sedimenti]MBD0379381.1 type II secretion system F family protein [Paenibacillus sedimenti]
MTLVLIVLLVGVCSWFLLLQLERRRGTGGNQVSGPEGGEQTFAQSHTLVDYDDYRLTTKERITAIVMLALPAVGVGYVFYKSIFLALAFGAVGLLFPRIRRKQLILLRKNKLHVQFKQALSCLSSSMIAGKSIETAFREALEDMKMLYPDPNCLIVVEFGIICRRVENGEPIEAALKNFADRSHLEDVSSFTDVFLTCKRTGGNLVEVMKRTAGVIGEKLEITQDIAVMIAQKRFESRVLLFAPIVIVAILAFTSPEYMDPLYTGSGVLIMTASLLLLAACYGLTQKIMNIKV